MSAPYYADDRAGGGRDQSPRPGGRRRMTEETKLEAALERAAERYVTPWWSAGVCATCEHPECVEHRASAALLRSLAAACKAYREAYEKWNATARAVACGSAPVGFVAVYDDTESALLALARGETPNHTARAEPDTEEEDTDR